MFRVEQTGFNLWKVKEESQRTLPQAGHRRWGVGGVVAAPARVRNVKYKWYFE